MQGLDLLSNGSSPKGDGTHSYAQQFELNPKLPI